MNPLPTERDILNVIVNNFLSSVTFVMDYLQLEFNGLQLTVLTEVGVVRQGREVHLNEIDYRNVLCDQIGHVVSKVEIRAGDAIRIYFDNNNIFCISIKEEHYVGPEGVIVRNLNTGCDILIM